MKKLYVIGLLFLLMSFTARKQLFLTPKNWPDPWYNFSKNKLSRDKIALGRALFYDPILSKNNTISCASCHSQFSAFTHVDHALSHGIRDSIGIRNAPALMNLAWQKEFMRDGAINHLDMQALAPISNAAEMGSSIDSVVYKLQNTKRYPSLYFKAFRDSSITGEKTLKAIAQFMLTLVSANSKYDKVLRKEAKFTEQELNGYTLFQKNCSSCHQEPLFTNGKFANIGLPIDSMLKDYGRMGITKNPEDSLKFKVPTLRNIEFSYPYMHDGRFKKLSEVLNHYTKSIIISKSVAPELINPLILTSREKVDLTAFLLTLTDKEFLFNREFSYPKELLLNIK